ncbi:uncharacterized protein MKK02DRAFT_27888 [Dioszegia hungarica]|uniref:Uncharacterized protein n=1 Tax=Dioszegia hungarica TaxID=4972 RepID=A0AA38H674_9TREE|nr:uncharacterized protein MKK02DRAFT_27888 [Dioszegia hungarica]KAI9634730.1 hypothetical protein MKK02DRAFT_27888 [Dioszegia hungarica]
MSSTVPAVMSWLVKKFKVFSCSWCTILPQVATSPSLPVYVVSAESRSRVPPIRHTATQSSLTTSQVLMSKIWLAQRVGLIVINSLGDQPHHVYQVSYQATQTKRGKRRWREACRGTSSLDGDQFRARKKILASTADPSRQDDFGSKYDLRARAVTTRTQSAPTPTPINDDICSPSLGLSSIRLPETFIAQPYPLHSLFCGTWFRPTHPSSSHFFDHTRQAFGVIGGGGGGQPSRSWTRKAGEVEGKEERTFGTRWEAQLQLNDTTRDHSTDVWIENLTGRDGTELEQSPRAGRKLVYLGLPQDRFIRQARRSQQGHVPLTSAEVLMWYGYRSRVPECYLSARRLRTSTPPRRQFAMDVSQIRGQEYNGDLEKRLISSTTGRRQIFRKPVLGRPLRHSPSTQLPVRPYYLLVAPHHLRPQCAIVDDLSNKLNYTACSFLGPGVGRPTQHHPPNEFGWSSLGRSSKDISIATPLRASIPTHEPKLRNGQSINKHRSRPDRHGQGDLILSCLQSLLPRRACHLRPITDHRSSLSPQPRRGLNLTSPSRLLASSWSQVRVPRFKTRDLVSTQFGAHSTTVLILRALVGPFRQHRGPGLGIAASHVLGPSTPERPAAGPHLPHGGPVGFGQGGL